MAEQDDASPHRRAAMERGRRPRNDPKSMGVATGGVPGIYATTCPKSVSSQQQPNAGSLALVLLDEDVLDLVPARAFLPIYRHAVAHAARIQLCAAVGSSVWCRRIASRLCNLW